MAEIMHFPVIKRPEPQLSVLSSRRRIVSCALQRLESYDKYEAYAFLWTEFNRLKRELDAKAD